MRTRSILAVLLLASACSGRAQAGDPDGPGTMCTMEARSALAVTPMDAVTGARVTGAVVRVTDGTHSENLAEFDGVYSGAHERAGTYTIVVSHPDYRQWQRAGVVVREDECHVITEVVEARLTGKGAD